jgi:SAM-dependent methyltransferase
MRPQGKVKLGFYPLPAAEARRLRNCFVFAKQFSALDPCVGDGVAFKCLLDGINVYSYGIEIDARRAEQAKALGIDTLHANTMDVRCPADTLSLLYMNPPYDLEAGHTNNQRLELVFLEHTYRWLKPGGVLLFIIPQPQLRPCARLLAEHFSSLRVYRLREPECLEYQQVAILASRRKRHDRTRDSALLESIRYLESLADRREIETLGEAPEAKYEVPPSDRAVLTNTGIPLDEVEDLLLISSAYRQATRFLVREQSDIKGRPLTPLHGGHVGLLCTAGMLNGIFGEGESRHIAHWRSVKFTDHWEESEEDGTIIQHDRERFSHELTLIFANGKTQILAHEKASQ